MSTIKFCAKGCGRPRYRTHTVCNQCRCRKDAKAPPPLAPVDIWMGRFWLPPADRGRAA